MCHNWMGYACALTVTPWRALQPLQRCMKLNHQLEVPSHRPVNLAGTEAFVHLPWVVFAHVESLLPFLEWPRQPLSFPLYVSSWPVGSALLSQPHRVDFPLSLILAAQAAMAFSDTIGPLGFSCCCQECISRPAFEMIQCLSLPALLYLPTLMLTKTWRISTKGADLT